MATKTHSVQVPVTSGEYKTLRKSASEQGMSTRAYAKERLFGGASDTTLPASPQATSEAIVHSVPDGTPANIYIENATFHLPAGTRIVAPNVSSVVGDGNVGGLNDGNSKYGYR
jgi:hypothetical protein